MTFVTIFSKKFSELNKFLGKKSKKLAHVSIEKVCYWCQVGVINQTEKIYGHSKQFWYVFNTTECLWWN